MRVTIQTWTLLALGAIFSAISVRHLIRLHDWPVLACIVVVNISWSLVAFDFYWKLRSTGESVRNANYMWLYLAMFAGFACNVVANLIR